VEQCDAIGVDQTEQGRVRHRPLGPLPLVVEEPKQLGAAGQLREPVPVIPPQPAIKGPITNPFEGKQQGNGDHFAGIEMGMRLLLCIRHLVIHTAKQVNDKIFGSHEGTLLLSARLLE
jgi:hypothetical protein